MAYVKTIWIDDETPVSAEKMNKIEQELSDNQTITRGYAVRSVTLPVKNVSTFTIVTVAIPIPTTIEEMNVMLPGGALIVVFKNLNYCLIDRLDVPNIKPNNKGLGATSVLTKNSLVLTTGDQASPYARCADMYILGAGLYLKFFNYSTSEAVTDLVIPIEYIARG